MSESADHRRGIALAKWFGLMMFAILVLAAPAAGQDRTNPGTSMTEGDQKVGALGCAYAILVEVQARTAICDWARQPADDAIDEAIAALEDFMLANSSRLTRPMLEEIKRIPTTRLRGHQEYCGDRNNELIRQFRDASPSQIREWAKVALSAPARPGPYGCL
jgi:hypothetical protein